MRMAPESASSLSHRSVNLSVKSNWECSTTLSATYQGFCYYAGNGYWEVG